MDMAVGTALAALRVVWAEVWVVLAVLKTSRWEAGRETWKRRRKDQTKTTLFEKREGRILTAIRRANAPRFSRVVHSLFTTYSPFFGNLFTSCSQIGSSATE
jgi:hypothetical protein